MSKQLKPDTEALDAYFASWEPIDVRPRTPSTLPTASSRVSSGIRSTRRLCLEQLEARDVPAVFLGEAPIDDTPMSFSHDGMASYEEVSAQLVPHASGVVVNNANVNFGEGVTIKVSTGTGGGTVLNDGALESLHDAYDILHGTAANPLGTDHMTFNFQNRLDGALAIHLKQLDPTHAAHGNVLIDGPNGRTTVAIPADGVIPWNPGLGIDAITVINVHEQGELNPLGLSGIDVRMFLATTPTDLSLLQTQEASLVQQLATANTALSTAQANASPAPIRSLPWSQGVNAANHTLGKLNAHPGQNLYAVHFSPDGSRFVTAGQDKVAKIWNASTGALERTLTGNTSLVIDAVWSSDGQSIWTTGYDKHVRQYSASTGAVQWDSGDLGAMALSAAMSSDGTTLTVSMNGAAPKVINTQTKAINALGSGLIWTGQMTAMNDANVLMYVNTNAYRSGNYALIVNPATRQTVWQSNVIGGQLNAIAATPDGQWIVAGDDAGGLTVWKRSTNQQMFTLPNQGAAITSMAITSGNVLLVGSGNQLNTFDLRTLANNQAPVQGQTYASTGNGPRSISIFKDVAMFTSGDGGASGVIAEDLRVLPGYQDPATAVNATQTQVNSLTTQLADTRAQIAVLQGQEEQRSNLVQALDAKTAAETHDQGIVNALTQRMTTLSEWTLTGKADRLHALADRGAALTQAAADVRDELAMLEAQLSSDPAFYGALQDQAQQHVATLFGLSEQWSALQAEFDAVDWTKLSPKTLERLFPGSVEQSQTTLSVVQTSGNTVTLAIGGGGPMSVALQHGDAYLGRRTINTAANPPAFQTVTLMLDRTTASGPQTVNLLGATGTVISTVTLNWNKDTNTLSVADNANLFTPQGMAKDLGTMTYQQLFEQAETEEVGQMTKTQNAITQQGLVGQINSAIITNNLISNNNGVMTSFVQLQNEQLLYLVCNTMGAPYDFAVSEAKFTASFYAAFPQWKEENRQQTMVSYHLSSPNFDYYREAERNGWHQKIYPFNMTAASIIAASMDAVLAIRRGQDPTSYIAQANSLSSGGGPLTAMGIQLPTANAALAACEAYLEQHASEFLEFQAPYVEQINQLWQSYSTGNSWAGGGAGSLSANQQAEANRTHQINLNTIEHSEGIGSAIERMAGYVLANPGSRTAVSQLPQSQQTAIYAAIATLQNAGVTVKDGGVGKLAEAKEKLADGNFMLASLTLRATTGVNFTEGTVSPRSISWMHGVDAVGGTTSHTFTVQEPLLLEGVFTVPSMSAGRMQLTDAAGRVVFSLLASRTLPASVKHTLLPGNYRLEYVMPATSIAAEYSGVQFGLQADLVATKKNDIEGTLQLGAKVMPVSLKVAEFLPSGARNTDYTGTDSTMPNVKTLDLTKPVRIVIHGREDSPDSGKFVELEKALIASGYQVVTLDWNSVSSSNWPHAFGMQGENGIEVVADWAYAALKSVGVSGSMIRIGGHSWGSFVGYEIAERYKQENGFGVDTFVAMDSAADPTLGARYDASQVNFTAVSKTSTAFHSSILGSSGRANSAQHTIELRSPDVLDPIAEHGLAVTAFANLIRLQKIDPANAIASQLAFSSTAVCSLPDRDGVDAWMWVEGAEETSQQSSDRYVNAIPTKLTSTNPDDAVTDVYIFNALRDLTATIGQ